MKTCTLCHKSYDRNQAWCEKCSSITLVETEDMLEAGGYSEYLDKQNRDLWDKLNPVTPEGLRYLMKEKL